MRIPFLLFSLLIFQIMTIKAQNGSINADQLKAIESSFEMNADNIALMNAISNNKISDLAVNRSVAGKTDHLFTYRVKTTGITNQKQSGRCWMFTGLNVLRPKVIDHYNLKSFEFSTNYLYFWDLFEKSNLFLQEIILSVNSPLDDKRVEYLLKNVVGDGGVWNSLANLVEKYGAVPKEIMPETYQSENTSQLNRILVEKLRQDAMYLRGKYQNKKISTLVMENEKLEMMKDVYRILALSLGVPPKDFEWRYEDKDGKISDFQKFTPKSFVKEAIPELNLQDYVLFMNDPSRPYYQLYEIDLDRNVIEGKNWLYINLPADEIKPFAIASIKANEAMYASCDVGKQLNREEGVLDPRNYDYANLFGINLSMDKKQRIQTYQSGSSHGMALVAVDLNKDEKAQYWQFENSWGSTNGHEGYLTFTDEWFNEYLFRVVVLKKFVDPKILKILDQKPILLPPWDPMFLMDE
ncbi:MAG: C1 family peptidase [Bacteroidales bacterium]|nr:C1 family peptidase [Bacteroidales bacterium]